MFSRRVSVVLWLAALGVWLALAAANLWLGDLNQDEGWYLYAARLVAEGQVPYRDFGFTQGPVLPFVYSLFDPLVQRWGLAAGRAVTAGLGLLGSLAAAAVAWRIASGGRRHAAALIAFSLIAINVYHSSHCSVVKTYSLCGLFLAVGFLLLTWADRRRYGPVCAAAAGACLVLAGATRLSAAVVLPVVLVTLAWTGLRVGRADEGASRGRSAWLWVLAGACACGLVFVPLLLSAGDNVVFWLVRYHSARDVGGLLTRLTYKAGFISRVVQGYFVACCLCAVSLLWRMMVRGHGPCASDAQDGGQESRLGQGVCRALPAAMWISVVAMTAAHLAAPFPYDDYQVAVFPLFAAVLAGFAAGLPRREEALPWLVTAVLVASIAGAFSSPVNQAWAITGRDRIWWITRDRSPVAKLRDAAAVLKGVAGADRRVLTQDTYLAVEAGLRVPRGMEMGPFCYYPDWDDATADRRHVLNRAMFETLLAGAHEPAAAFSGYGLAIRCPEVGRLPEAERLDLERLLLDRYHVVRVIDGFGQALTTLRILARNEAETERGEDARRDSDEGRGAAK